MKVVVLGGYGHYGRYIARKLAERDIVQPGSWLTPCEI